MILGGIMVECGWFGEDLWMKIAARGPGMLCPCEPRSLIFRRNYNEMGAGPLLFVPVQRLFGHFVAV